MNIVYLSLGTNLGNKLENLQNAIHKIGTIGKVIKISSVYQTAAWGFESDDFFNIAIALETPLTASRLIEVLLSFETELGRNRDNKTGYQARPLDIDIIFFNDNIINTDQLTVPHPRMHDRKFVLIPMIEITKNYKHPSLNKKLETLSADCKDTSELTQTKHILSV